MKPLARPCRCTGSSEPSLIVDVKLKSKIMILDFLLFKQSNLFNEMLPTIIYKAMSDGGPYSLHFPKYYIPFATLVITVCKYHFISLTKRHISEHYRVRPDAVRRNTWSESAMFAKSDKLQTSGKKKKKREPTP